MKKLSFLCVLLFTVACSFANESFTAREVYGEEANTIWQGAEHIWLKQENTVPAFIQFRNEQEPDEQLFFSTLKKAFHRSTSYSFLLIQDERDELGWQHKRFQLMVHGVPVSNGIFILHIQNGLVKKYNGYLFKNITAQTSASVQQASALAIALQHIGASQYKWQLPEEELLLKQETGDLNATYFPKGALEILQLGKNESNDFRLVWKFDVYAQEPMSRNYVYVDATNGQVLNTITRIHHANTTGTATTVFRGNRTITADSYTGQYRLKEAPRGLGIHTYNMQKGTSYGNAVEFLDANNVWNNVNANLDQYAGDAHWGGEMTYDFYTSMGRNSIDNAGFALNLYMHYNTNYVNAFWDGSRMTFGDGNNSYKPLVSLDITGHEISHGLTERTSNLTYQGESGALNESFSDIFGTAVEWYADSTVANWLLAEDIGTPFRSLSNPNTYGDPDTYLGTNWYTGTGDNGGVHTNSGVQNHWYYRLAQGGTGTNDIGNAFNVTGIGRNKATKIAWRNDVTYLTSSADYADARFYAIQSANDLYGVCSPEAISTTRAWYAVGVGPNFVSGAQAQFTGSPVIGCTAPLTVNFTNTSSNTSTYTWYFGDGTTSTLQSPSHVYNALGVYTVKLVANGGSCGIDSLTRSNYVNVNTNNACEVVLPVTGSYQTQTACNGTIYDNGGPSGNYTNNTNSTLTIAPTGASQVKLHFTQFNMEANYDYLYVYNGPTTASPVIGSYTGTTIPADITSTGSSITIRQYSDQSVVAAGFTIQWTCINPTSPPVANFKADVTQSCSGKIQFTDLSTGGANAWLWTFGDGTTSTLQHPTHEYIQNGVYSVSLKATNAFGNNTITKTNYINITKPAGPAVTNQSSCGPKSFTLNLADLNPLTWFDSSGNVVSNTNPFVTPVLNTTTAYYVQDTQQQPIYHVGPLTNGIGSGSNYNTTQTRALRFRVFKHSKLVSVLVYAVGDGYRTVQYRDSLGGVITNRTVFIPNGTSRINLNIDLLPGGPYELGLRDTMNLYRNSTGAVYPYNDANGIVSIIGNNAANSATYYYFFYDWEVKEQDCISQRVPVVATVYPSVAVNASSTNVSCFGGTNGTATVSAITGTPSFNYTWSNSASTAAISNLNAGTYTVTVRDANLCSATASRTVTQPTLLVPSASASHVLCNGASTGSINVTTSGGTASYSYNWGGGITSQNRTNVPAGTYTLTVTDANLCTATTSALVNQPTAIVPVSSVTPVLCNGGNTGAITMNISGGTGSYTYHWGGGITSQNRLNLAAGTFTVTITDANLCTATASATVTQPAALLPTSSITAVACNGGNDGAISMSASGGTGAYSYNWGAGIIAASRTNLSAGTYIVTVTDGNACSATSSVIITEPPALSPSVNSFPAHCGASNGSAIVSVAGGTPGYSYLWSNNGASDEILNLAPGNYQVTIIDAQGCSATSSTLVNGSSSAQTLVSFSPVSCAGVSDGSASVQVIGGTLPINYLWSTGSTNSSIQNLTGGSYAVTITDGSNCVALENVTITEPDSIAVSVNIQHPVCFGEANGAVSVLATGGNANYSFNWSVAGFGSSLTGLQAGSYSVTVFDGSLCSVEVDFVLQNPDPVMVVPGGSNPLCYGGESGTAVATATGGTVGYSYLWFNGESTSDLIDLPAGSYAVTVTDASGCTGSSVVVLTQPDSMQAAFTSTAADIGAQNGSVVIDNLIGGVAPYQFAWSRGDNTQNLLNAGAGVYTVTITDANGCEQTVSITVSEKPTNVNTWERELSVSVYPNPATTALTVLIQSLQSEATLNLKNILGQTLLHKSIHAGQIEFDLSPFASGVYLLEVNQGEHKWVKQVIISK